MLERGTPKRSFAQGERRRKEEAVTFKGMEVDQIDYEITLLRECIETLGRLCDLSGAQPVAQARSMLLARFWMLWDYRHTPYDQERRPPISTVGGDTDTPEGP